MTHRIVTVLLLFGLLAGCGNEQSESIPEGQAPDFSLPTHTGDTFTLSEHTGSVVVINFWATWCTPCRAEIPDFVELQREYADRGLQFVGVSLDREGFEVVKPFADKMNINYPLVVDEGDLNKKYGGIPAIPTTFIVGKEGRIRDYVVGQTGRTELLGIVEGLLNESTRAVASTSEQDDDGQ